MPGSVLYEFARFVTDSWDDEYPGKPFTVDAESSRLAIAADLADLIAGGRYEDAHTIAEQTHGGTRLALALARTDAYLSEFAAALDGPDA